MIPYEIHDSSCKGGINKMDYRLVNRLWLEPVETFSIEDLNLLKQAFEIGFIPLGDAYGEHNPKWVEWKNEVKYAIKIAFHEEGI